MRASFSIGLSLALCSQALAFGKHLNEGKYVCLSDRAVGIQGEADHRYAGKIELPANKKRFFLAVERIRDIPDRCWNPKIVEHLRSAVEKDDDYDVQLLPDFYRPGDFANECLSRWVISINLGNTLEKLKSINGFTFEEKLSDLTVSTFEFGPSGRFQWIFKELLTWSPYIAEGRCDIVG